MTRHHTSAAGFVARPVRRPRRWTAIALVLTGACILWFAETAGAALTAVPRRMAPATALNFLTVGLSLLFLDQRTRQRQSLSPVAT